jgi:SAM-dependent methyltransferase
VLSEVYRSGESCNQPRSKRSVASIHPLPLRIFGAASASIFGMLICSVCGGASFESEPVLWDKLVCDWQLAPHERAYIDRQQGTRCKTCGSNLRSIALANAIRGAVGTDLTLGEYVATVDARRLAVLEINEAANLNPVLSRLPGHALARYPSVDVHNLPYANACFDLVLHSDTLEHVSNPLRALAECRRVLRPKGVLCFTIPTIIGRLTRSRAGLPKSYHGSAETGTDDFLVHTEFGADMWTYVLQAGFSTVSVNAVEFPAALALSARNEPISACVRSLPQAKSLRPERVVSVHFPKAAGSSLKSQFATLLGDAVSLDYSHDPLTPAGAETAPFPDGKRIVHGHFRAQRYASANAYWITFLRHPVDNLISIYSYWKSLMTPGHELHGRFLRERPSIFDFAAYPGIRRLMSETYFGEFDMNRFDFIGFHETRDVDVRRLAEALNLPLVAEIHENKTIHSTERQQLEADPSIRLRLEDLLAEDVAFYERLRYRHGLSFGAPNLDTTKLTVRP